ncbi:ATP-binding protein [Cesiribacter andamanensis]|uniref:histidine kinase n=1 Tax=Cesiribacter andamanensis AMV16 TaxID=1279009 RepID=M7N006_9BACT|nr:ATP-binding protein [Cesiribacter andamanensis]EMR02023.1 Phytochrome-like protein cph1 [Cesiribacter andamanensis AMV16]
MKQPDIFSLFDKQEFDVDGTATITSCEREPIHIPGAIQAHGALLLLDSELTIRQVSENVADYFHRGAASLLDQPVRSLLGDALAAEIAIRFGDVANQQQFTASVAGASVQEWHISLHHNQGGIVLELEPANLRKEISLSSYTALINNLQATDGIAPLAQKAAEAVRELSGFSRVMVYQFLEDKSGRVIGESVQQGMASYMGHYFPASDIPPQARTLYLHNPSRYIPDVDYTPVSLLPGVNPLTGKPLNLSLSSLRSVSPIHLQYLRNMGVGASMSFSIILEGTLWGLIACHHRQPLHLGHAQREACYLLSKSFGTMLQERYRREEERMHKRIMQVQTPLLQRMAQASDMASSLYLYTPTIKDLLDCSGCAVCAADGIHLLGKTPTTEQVQELVAWLHKDVMQEVYSTNSLASEFPAARAYTATASGLLAIAVSRIQREYILWFRPELVQTVRWAGRPDDEIKTSAGSLHQLEPRKSFASWQETVRGVAQAWKPVELQAARDMRGLLVDVVMRVSGELNLKADILSRLNLELERSTNELDSFAYIASHDLKEPLRGIFNYSQFLLEDYGDKLDEAGKEKLSTLIRLSVRMEQLLDSLLQYSRIGRMEIHKTEVDLNQTLQEVRDMLQQPIDGRQVHIRLAEQLPTICCDELQVLELFQNLIANAIKYNTQPQVEVEIGCRPPDSTTAAWTFYVKDNGIGIEQRHFDAIFTIFRRLHARHAYGGGTGVGLTIVKKIVERHGGEIWLESEPGRGSTFFFTLPEENKEH